LLKRLFLINKKMREQMEKLKKFFKEEDGVTALEYTLLASLLIFVIMVFFTPIRNLASRIWSEINSFLATT